MMTARHLAQLALGAFLIVWIAAATVSVSRLTIPPIYDRMIKAGPSLAAPPDVAATVRSVLGAYESQNDLEIITAIAQEVLASPDATHDRFVTRLIVRGFPAGRARQIANEFSWAR